MDKTCVSLTPPPPPPPPEQDPEPHYEAQKYVHFWHPLPLRSAGSGSRRVSNFLLFQIAENSAPFPLSFTFVFVLSPTPSGQSCRDQAVLTKLLECYLSLCLHSFNSICPPPSPPPPLMMAYPFAKCSGIDRKRVNELEVLCDTFLNLYLFP